MKARNTTNSICLATALGIVTIGLVVGANSGWFGVHPRVTVITAVAATIVTVAMLRFPWSLPPAVAEDELPELPEGWRAQPQHLIFEPCWQSVVRQLVFTPFALPCIGMVGTAVTGWEP